MRYESIAARILLVSTALLWYGVLRLEGQKQPEELSSYTQSESSSNESVLCIVRSGTLEPTKAAKVQEVRTTLSSLFENLEYFGTIEPDDFLAYYPFLLDLSIVKKWYPERLEQKLMTWPLPKGNLTLSLLISTGPIRESTFDLLASYLPYISEMAARQKAVQYCFDACAEGSMDFSSSLCRILGSVFEPSVVSKLKRVSIPSAKSNALIASSLLHFPPAELDPALGDDLNKGLAEVVAATNWSTFYLFCTYFIRYPTILRHPDTMQAIFERNTCAFQASRLVSSARLTILSAINKIKFGTSFVFTSMSKEEWIELFDWLNYWSEAMVSLVFSIWAREDASADVWGQFATYSFDTDMLSKLAFNLDRFFENCFDANLFQDDIFTLILKRFKYCPNSSKKQQFLALLRAKVQDHPDVVQAVFWDDIEVAYTSEGPFHRLLNFFIEQDDKEGLQALSDIISQEIVNVLSTKLDHNTYGIVRICQRLGGGVHRPLRRLAERVGGAKVLGCLVFYQIRANDMGEMLRTLGISREQMNAALASLSDTAASGDELAEVLKKCCSFDRHFSVETLPWCHALWYYLWEQNREAFVEHVDPCIWQHYVYLSVRPSLFTGLVRCTLNVLRKPSVRLLFSIIAFGLIAAAVSRTS